MWKQIFKAAVIAECLDITAGSATQINHFIRKTKQ
jgi:hypothetical protein